MKDFSYEKSLVKMRKKYKRSPYKEPLEHVLWMTREDKLYKLYEEYKEVFAEGTVYYAQLAQANSMLMDDSEFMDCPAMLIYSTDEWVNNDPECMKKLIGEIFLYKFRTDLEVPDKYKDVIEKLSEDMDRPNFKFEITMPNGKKANFHYATVLVYREFLPGGYFKGEIVPVIAAPDKYETVMVAPQKYWTKDKKRIFLSTEE